MSAVLQKLKRFKLRALHNQKKFGVAGRSCEEVLRKACLHLQLPVPGSSLCLYEDGTELTGDYFWSVPDDSELVLLTAGQTWQGYASDISRFLSVFQKPHAELIQAARQLLSDERAPLRQKLLADLLGTVSENIAAETRAEDAPWFEGLESRFRNKSGYLRYSCESRIRSYLRESSSWVRGCRLCLPALSVNSPYGLWRLAPPCLSRRLGRSTCGSWAPWARSSRPPATTAATSTGGRRPAAGSARLKAGSPARVPLTWTTVLPDTPSTPTVTGRAASSLAPGTWTT
ncbi:DNA fragmentation factor subunit beta isoform X4 [Balaenoptera acutorostrata]|uniref:DNAation factor subunit beta isoform X4 n=1 Tax=Balaenoptera acutorostrata TaxID=9767 RepID=A0ABM3U8F5_BALAC|nr:DNA fragmentation factor subunit beta isoform X4 [Balaenoptera acutorostrata]